MGTLELVISPHEVSQGQLTAAHLGLALTALQEDGFVILANIVAHQHLDLLRARMARDTEGLLAAAEWGGAGRVPGHMQQDPPPFAPYVFPDIVANPLVVQVTKALLGDGLYCGFYSGNTNCPGSGRQPLHLDMGHLWPGRASVHPAYALIVNVCLVDVTEANGSTELWPGSHLDTRAQRTVEETVAELRRRENPPVRGNTPKGSVLIRDPRLWHRGVPNLSNEPRHMIAMIHTAHWYQRGKPVVFNVGCAEALAGSDLEWHARFVNEPIDYLLRSRR